jgi:splicing factor 3A subunit 3
LNRMQELCIKLKEGYKNSSDMSIVQKKRKHADSMSMFYTQLRRIKEEHRGREADVVNSPEEELFSLRNRYENDKFLDTMQFSGEEYWGKCLDLTLMHEKYINMKLVDPKPDYLVFLNKLPDLLAVNEKNLESSKETLHSPAWNSFIMDLIEYLEGFFHRSKPLYPLQMLKSECRERFKEENKELDMSLYCGACDKWFISDGVFKGHLSGKKHKRAQEQNTPSESPIYQHILWKMYWASQMIQELKDVIDETIEHIERKQSRTAEERESDYKDMEQNIGESIASQATLGQDDADSRLYNPLKLPLGWDGKPIPYWLYKLHGLGKEYPCEICGNYIYMGRKAYERHFQEWRHSYGMKCLGIPNTKHFQDISHIDDAIALWKKIQEDLKKERFRPEIMEEFEDEQGNIFNRKTYEDLVRQGLI